MSCENEDLSALSIYQLVTARLGHMQAKRHTSIGSDAGREHSARIQALSKELKRRRGRQS